VTSDEQSTAHYIEFRNVWKAFDDQAVLEDVSFHVDPGETVVILGRSGVGKSVTLSHIMGFLKPDAGRVFVAHRDITEAAEEELLEVRKRITLVFQSGALFDSLTIGENVAFPLRERRDLSDEDIEKIVEGMLEVVNIGELRDRLPSELSTGMKRAVAIARALAAKPEAILYDEPTTMVDPGMSVHIAGLIQRLKQQLRLTSVVVTHDTHLARKLADHVVFLHEGKVAFFGPFPGLAESDQPFVRDFLQFDELAEVGE
jgi:phospholipid/cholesterol/gamma-HCH transport system ATP-binding protein